ncbi:MAG TPA: crosslink repair DNA glycosylase YcaQ family protein [Candidatus Limnocylindrales bacterium]
MTDPISLSPDAARRFLARRHLLAPPRSLPPSPASVMRVIERLGSLQFDPLDVAGRNHDLILLARIAGYRREWTETLLYVERALFETYNKQLSILPTSELPWYRISWERRRRSHESGAFAEHPEAVDALLARIREVGPVTTSDVDAGHAIDWYWGPTSRGRALLEALAESGHLGIARRAGNRRYYDLVERLFPAELLASRRPERDQLRHKLLSRYRAHGLLGTAGNGELWAGIRHADRDGEAVGLDGDGAETLADPAPAELRRSLLADLVADGTLVPVTIGGIRGTRYALAEEVSILEAATAPLAPDEMGVAFLGPLDPLAWDRPFLRALYGFDYVWEVYTPAARRRWGYYVLPVLFGDRLVGRIEPRLDRAGRTLRVLGLWWEPEFDPLALPDASGFLNAFAAALDAHRAFADLRSIELPSDRRLRPFVRALRDVLPRPRRRAAPGRRTIEAPNETTPDT